MKPLDDLLHPGDTLMVGTPADLGTMKSRPLTVVRVADGRVSILLDQTAPWACDLTSGEVAHATASDVRKNQWVSITGILSLSTDAAEIDDLWNPAADAFFDDGRDSPGIAVLRIDVQTGSYWSGPSGRLGSLISLIRAKFGDTEDSGEHGEVGLPQ